MCGRLANKLTWEDRPAQGERVTGVLILLWH
jgi:hypothetical protein